MASDDDSSATDKQKVEKPFYHIKIGVCTPMNLMTRRDGDTSWEEEIGANDVAIQTDLKWEYRKKKRKCIINNCKVFR